MRRGFAPAAGHQQRSSRIGNGLGYTRADQLALAIAKGFSAARAGVWLAVAGGGGGQFQGDGAEQGSEPEVVEQALGHAGPYRRWMLAVPPPPAARPSHPATERPSPGSSDRWDAIAASPTSQGWAASGLARQAVEQGRGGARNRPSPHRPPWPMSSQGGARAGGAAAHPSRAAARRGRSSRSMSWPTLTQRRVAGHPGPRRPVHHLLGAQCGVVSGRLAHVSGPRHAGPAPAAAACAPARRHLSCRPSPHGCPCSCFTPVPPGIAPPRVSPWPAQANGPRRAGRFVTCPALHQQPCCPASAPLQAGGGRWREAGHTRTSITRVPGQLLVELAAPASANMPGYH